MTADPRTIAADLEEEALEWGCEDPIVPNLHAACHHLRAVVAPLHDAWLKAKPPCPTCGGKAKVQMFTSAGYERWQPCPECSHDCPPGCPWPLGVQPFDKWTAGLVADNERANRWAYKTTVLVFWIKENCTPEQADDAREYLRQIGATQ